MVPHPNMLIPTETQASFSAQRDIIMKNLPLSFQSVMFLYLKNVRCKYEWKNERKWCSCKNIIFDKCV